MAKRRKAKTVTATLPMETMEQLAAELDPMYPGQIRNGRRLTSKCRLWRRKDRTWTVRFVYEDPIEPGLVVTTIFRGVEFA
ncbi:hypothetical protein [Aureimonas sp. SK2]|uniref:hypothetical protein n=1 Tax=Aureimonas sp. SK2 TaxID=3015992 RepID=UPI00244379BD|nr:hypothetical protein [Aureimonas sp. SK2]